MASGSGLGSQLMFAEETGSWGTAVTVTKSPEYTSETIELQKGILQGLGLRAGGFVARAARRVISTRSVSGGITLDCATRGMGLLFKHGLGSTNGLTAPVVITGTAYKQVHQLNSTDSMGLTVQTGIPQTNTTVQPFTYNGMKVTDLEFSCSDGQIAQLVVSFDGKNETTATALATYSPVSGVEVFNFSQGTVKLGGTVATTTGLVAITSGVTVTSIIKGVTVKVTRSLATSRFGLGNAGLKAEQIMNGYYDLTVTLDTEFTSRTELYDLFSADTGTAVQITFVGSQIAATGSFHTIDFVIPVVKFDTAPLNVAGPDIVTFTATGKILSNGVDNELQLTYISEDSVL